MKAMVVNDFLPKTIWLSHVQPGGWLVRAFLSAIGWTGLVVMVGIFGLGAFFFGWVVGDIVSAFRDFDK